MEPAVEQLGQLAAGHSEAPENRLGPLDELPRDALPVWKLELDVRPLGRDREVELDDVGPIEWGRVDDDDRADGRAGGKRSKRRRHDPTADLLGLGETGQDLRDD